MPSLRPIALPFAPYGVSGQPFAGKGKSVAAGAVDAEPKLRPLSQSMRQPRDDVFGAALPGHEHVPKLDPPSRHHGNQGHGIAHPPATEGTRRRAPFVHRPKHRPCLSDTERSTRPGHHRHHRVAHRPVPFEHILDPPLEAQSRRSGPYTIHAKESPRTPGTATSETPPSDSARGSGTLDRLPRQLAKSTHSQVDPPHCVLVTAWRCSECPYPLSQVWHARKTPLSVLISGAVNNPSVVLA